MDGWMDGWMGVWEVGWIDGVRRSTINHGLTQEGHVRRNLVFGEEKLLYGKQSLDK